MTDSLAEKSFISLNPKTQAMFNSQEVPLLEYNNNHYVQASHTIILQCENI
jgi:hypothetical protein